MLRLTPKVSNPDTSRMGRTLTILHRNAFVPCFASHQESDVESTRPPEEWPLSLSTVERTKERQRVNSKRYRSTPLDYEAVCFHLLRCINDHDISSLKLFDSDWVGFVRSIVQNDTSDYWPNFCTIKFFLCLKYLSIPEEIPGLFKGYHS